MPHAARAAEDEEPSNQYANRVNSDVKMNFAARSTAISVKRKVQPDFG
jgi:hypothetical protein